MKNDERKNLNLKYGGYASVITAVAIIMVIVINMVASQLNIKFDLTKNKLYTISEDTLELLKGIDEDVSIYSVYADGSEISVVTEILDRYAANSRHVTVSNVDPYKNPQFAAKYAKDGNAVSIGSVIVETADNYKIISQQDLADVYTSQAGETYIQGIKLESVLTGAIRSLTSGESNVIYALTGHGESDVYDELITEMEYGGYSLNYFNIIKSGNIPEDCAVLMINAPTSDFTINELNIIYEYLNNGGELFITLGVTAEEMPNFADLLSNYGIADSRRMVIEGDANYVYQQNPYYLVPTLSADHAVSSRLAETNTSVFMPFAMSIDLLETKRSTVDIQAFAVTSGASYSKSIAQMSSYQKTEEDPSGPFAIGAAITDIDMEGTPEGVKVVILGSETVMETEINSIVNGGNFGLVMNSLDWLIGNDTSLRSKSLGMDEYLQLTQSKAIVIMGVCVIVIPVAILIAGLAVVLRRRNK